jgi:hypothetical protein
VTYCFLYPIVYNLSHAHNVHKTGKEKFKGRQRKTQRQAEKDSKAGKEKLKARQRKTQRKVKKDSKAGKE